MSPRPAFDGVIHEPTRLQLCGLLVPVVEAEFAGLRDRLRISDSALSKHLKALEAAGHVRVSKQAEQGRLRTWAALTETGRHAFCGHVAEIQRLAGVASLRARRRPAPVSLGRRPVGPAGAAGPGQGAPVTRVS